MNSINNHNSIIVKISLMLSLICGNNYENAFGQNNSLPAIDNHGVITDSKSVKIGTLTLSGDILNSNNVSVAHVDSLGNLINDANGNTVGRTRKNGSFIYYLDHLIHEKLKTSFAMNGICTVSTHGKSILLVDKKYKHYGASAYHFLTYKGAF